MCASETPGWTDVPNSTITFSLGGTAARHTLITVAFQSALSVETQGFVRLLVDGVVQGIGPMQISNLGGSELNYQTASYTNLTSALAPQSHVAKLQLFTAGNMFCIYHWTYAILHA